MKVLFDHQIFSLQKFGGISRYYYELLNAFNKIDDIEEKISLGLSNNHYLLDYKPSRHLPFFPNTTFRGKARIQSIVNNFYTSNRLRKSDFDVFHPTYYNTSFLKDLKEKPFVLTVYDMIHEKFPHLFFPTDTTAERKKILAEKASKIIAISESTKSDLMEILSIPEDKIEVIHLGNSLKISDKAKTPTNNKNYILFVGSRPNYKNFIGFINAVTPLLKKDPTLKIKCAGGGEFRKTELKLFKELGISNQILQQSFSDNTLAQLYNEAICFVFPSQYEGFGIPVLESFASSCPLVCSNTSSLPEVAGDAALYFDPMNIDDMHDTINKIINNESLRSSLIEKGKERLKLFSWETTAKQTKDVYKSIL